MSDLTKVQREFLEFVVTGRKVTVHDVSAALGKPLSAISNTRNGLLELGLLMSWRDYDDAIRVSDAGRRAIAKQAKP